MDIVLFSCSFICRENQDILLINLNLAGMPLVVAQIQLVKYRHVWVFLLCLLRQIQAEQT